ncbi:LysM peptidoglycan-binding domain-containing protein [Paenibacillus antri]|uniref:LysM peptidoglycan-binding domain-containing protein n=1 Tax=Paenibacillus antri TaxID=2582848 RepID=A0A5R9G527_9BACL|nr:LysM peptidoglycan-binding domain-containing protein [Paenibacillus antri]TLS50149.1 LysM peptidoglycan-binding domain-containing protein [Paenibacillus antri]
MRTNTYRQRNGKQQARKKFFVRMMMFLALIGFSATSGVMLHASANQEDNSTAVTTTAESAAQASVLDTGSILCVEPGDTLWKIAKAYGPDDVSVKSYVQSIIEANDLDSASLQVGQVLRLP